MGLPFEGVKVADFSWVGVGPITMRYLADYGATVVRIESIQRPDFLRLAAPFRDGEPGIDRSGFFANYNGGKLGASLDLKHPKALDVAKRFIAWADVVAESFTAGTIERLGLGYEAAREVNPGVIYFSSTNQGQTGPYRMQPGFGTQLVSLAGFTQIIGWPDGEPCGTYGAYTDFISPATGPRSSPPRSTGGARLAKGCASTSRSSRRGCNSSPRCCSTTRRTGESRAAWATGLRAPRLITPTLARATTGGA